MGMYDDISAFRERIKEAYLKHKESMLCGDPIDDIFF